MLTYMQTAKLPKDELFGLVSQMRRPAVSVASNIVEGCSRGSTIEYVRFLEVAYGSAREIEYQISLAERLYLTALLMTGPRWQPKLAKFSMV